MARVPHSLSAWPSTLLLAALLIAGQLAAWAHSQASSSGPVPAAPANSHGSVQLIAEDQSIEPGRESWVGLDFRLEPQWHIYWINPGDSGEPPQVRWELPASFRAGPLRWPYPSRLDHSPLTDFGYEDEVLLMAPIRTPARIGPGRVTLTADVNWLVCRDVCIPVEQHVSVSVPFEPGRPQPDPRWHKLFAEMQARCPKPAPAGWKATARANGNRFVLSIETGKPEARAMFFPLEPLQIEDAAPQEVTSFRTGVRLSLQKSEQLLKPIRALKGVVVLAPGQAFVINAPVIH